MIQVYPRQNQGLIVKRGKVSAKFPRYCQCLSDVPTIMTAIADARGL